MERSAECEKKEKKKRRRENKWKVSEDFFQDSVYALDYAY